MTTKTNYFLFSVDVEDFPVILDGKEVWAAGITEMVSRYLEFLRPTQMKATFFILGRVAESVPDLVKMILKEGHEVGCHGYDHVPLNKHTPASFALDIDKAMVALKQAGAADIKGYRAPFLSITPKTKWAYKVIAEKGFKYSSSVLPRYNPLFGWPGFGEKPVLIENVWEMPVTLMPLVPLGVPVAAGVYFRIMPVWLIKLGLKLAARKNKAILSYFHPYDVDFDSESRTCAWLTHNPVGNYLIFYNRHLLLKKLKAIVSPEMKIIPYWDYLKSTLV